MKPGQKCAREKGDRLSLDERWMKYLREAEAMKRFPPSVRRNMSRSDKLRRIPVVASPRPSGQGDGSRAAQLQAQFNRKFQHYLDKSVPHIKERWGAFAVVVLIYLLRFSFLHGYYIVTYGLGIYNLNLVIGFLSPQVDPATEGPTLPTKGNEEFKPFVRRLPEFKFWYRSIRSFVIAFFMTFVPIFDVPVFWPILLMYWFMLFFMTMKQQIRHMIKHRYVPFSFGKKQYGKGKGAGASADAASAGLKDDK